MTAPLSTFQKGILMLTAKGTLEDRVTGLDAGADDYLVKPFEFAELFARIRSISRRLQFPLSESVLSVGPLRLNTIDHTFTYAGKEIPLTVKEYQLLEILMRNWGRTVPREWLIEHIWGWDFPSRNALEALVKLTRKKLKDIPGLNIQNIRGVDYRLEVPDVLQDS